MISAARIVDLYDAWTASWHKEDFVTTDSLAFESALQTLHRANFELWHEEDKARTPNASDALIAQAKRNIDRINQKRNDQIERCDTVLLEKLARNHLPNPIAQLHSETPGLMLDRISILSLKRYHTLEEIERANAPAGHAERNRKRLSILERQRADLATCLDQLWANVLRGDRRFTLYRQLKMYNDPTLNPVIYKNSAS